MLVSIQALNRFYSRASDSRGQLDDARGSRARDRRQPGVRRAVSSRACVATYPVSNARSCMPAFRRAWRWPIARRRSWRIGEVPRPGGVILLAGDVPPDVAAGLAAAPAAPHRLGNRGSLVYRGEGGRRRRALPRRRRRAETHVFDWRPRVGRVVRRAQRAYFSTRCHRSRRRMNVRSPGPRLTPEALCPH